MSTTRTSTTCTATVGPAALVGRTWTVAPLPLWSGDTTAEADAYRIRNMSKTRTVQTWLGVRFAEPPVGTLRWREAVDYDYPAGTYQCDKFGNVPHQVYSEEAYTAIGGGNARPEWGLTNAAASPGIRDNSPESEDCLFLNIYRPNGAPPAGGWPIVFWVHGGGNVVRSATEPHERGHRLATEGLIVVSIEYRLGNFGYFYHPRLEDEPDWNGPSFAYSDVKSALRWVNRNIASFGGDPARVLIGGSSAGGAHMLHLMEDASVSSLFSSVWVSSGGGMDERPSKATTPEDMGYADRYARFHQGVRGVDGILRDYSTPTRTLEQAFIAAGAGGEGNAMRMGLSPDAIMALSDERMRLQFPNWNLGAATRVKRASQNVYPFRGNGINYSRGIYAAAAGAFTKPVVFVTAENEATMATDHPTWGAGVAGNYLRLLRVPSFQDWERAPWMPAWSTVEKNRQAYQHSIWHWPAWRMARAAAMAGNAYTYLMFWGFGAGAAPHTGDVTYIFGNLEWSAGMDGTQARVTERMVRMSDGIMRLIRNLAYNGNPNTNAAASSQTFNLFATRPSFPLAAYTEVNTSYWNIAGSTATLGGGTAPVQITHAEYLPGAWSYYNDAFFRNGIT